MQKQNTIRIGSRFHGPPNSGNGGYTCGLIAAHIQGTAAVRLRIPPPLETDLVLRQEDQALALYAGHDLVATAKPARIDIDIPASPGVAAAEAASKRYRGFKSHFYPGCFVCGPQREQGDGLHIFAGPVVDDTSPKGMVATTWVPDDSVPGSDGSVADEFVWAALDCPGAYAFDEPQTGAILLGELSVDIRAPVRSGEVHVVTGWEIEHTGRKHFTGTALFDRTGACCAVGHATWIEVPHAPPAAE